MANGLPSWNETSPVGGTDTPVQAATEQPAKLPSWEDTTPTQLPSWEATSELSPQAKRAEELRAEKQKYGFFDLLS